MRELNWIAREDSRAEVVTPLAAERSRRLGAKPVVAAWLVGALMAGVAVWALTGDVPDASLKRLSVSLPPEAPYRGPGNHALSPDGTQLVYAAAVGGGSQLYTRALDRFDPRPMPATEGALTPFFSPDGEWVGFGMMPGTVMYVYLGSLAGSLAALGTGSRTRTPGENGRSIRSDCWPRSWSRSMSPARHELP